MTSRAAGLDVAGRPDGQPIDEHKHHPQPLGTYAPSTSHESLCVKCRASCRGLVACLWPGHDQHPARHPLVLPASAVVCVAPRPGPEAPRAGSGGSPAALGRWDASIPTGPPLRLLSGHHAARTAPVRGQETAVPVPPATGPGSGRGPAANGTPDPERAVIPETRLDGRPAGGSPGDKGAHAAAHRVPVSAADGARSVHTIYALRCQQDPKATAQVRMELDLKKAAAGDLDLFFPDLTGFALCLPLHTWCRRRQRHRIAHETLPGPAREHVGSPAVPDTASKQPLTLWAALRIWEGTDLPGFLQSTSPEGRSAHAWSCWTTPPSTGPRRS